MQATIKKVSVTDKKKDGSLILNKHGKQSFRVGLQVAEYGETWINGFTPFRPDWKEGDKIEVEIYDEEWNGQKRKAFKLPPKKDSNEGWGKVYLSLGNLERKVDLIIDHLSKTKRLDHTSAGTPVPFEDDTPAEDEEFWNSLDQTAN